MSMPVAEKELEQIPENRTDLVALMRRVYQEERKAAGKQVLTLEQIKKEFALLPGEECRKYEEMITGFARNWADFIIKQTEKETTPSLLRQLLPPLDGSGTPLAYGTEEEKYAFAAFAVAVNYERLNKNAHEEKKLLEDYRKFFGKAIKTAEGADQYEHVFFFHMDVLQKMDVVANSDNGFKLELLNAAKDNSKNMTQNIGGHHAFAETVALVYEGADQQLRQQLDTAQEDWLGAAIASIEYVINEDAKAVEKKIAEGENKKRYAKFYCTYGRVLALCGEFDKALGNIGEAIALEDNTRTDYSIRIGQYSSHYQQIFAQKKLQGLESVVNDNAQQMKLVMDAQMQETKSAMNEHMEEMKLAMEAQEKESMAKNMEFLGLFSGIVSFTIGSLTITGAIAEQSIKHAAGLIVVLLGALMCVFAAFGMILHGFRVVKKDVNTQKYKASFLWRHLVVFILGALVVAGGILFCLN